MGSFSSFFTILTDQLSFYNTAAIPAPAKQTGKVLERLSKLRGICRLMQFESKSFLGTILSGKSFISVDAID
jgi:hypothetical protein